MWFVLAYIILGGAISYLLHTAVNTIFLSALCVDPFRLVGWAHHAICLPFQLEIVLNFLYVVINKRILFPIGHTVNLLFLLFTNVPLFRSTLPKSKGTPIWKDLKAILTHAIELSSGEEGKIGATRLVSLLPKINFQKYGDAWIESTVSVVLMTRKHQEVTFVSLFLRKPIALRCWHLTVLTSTSIPST